MNGLEIWGKGSPLASRAGVLYGTSKFGLLTSKRTSNKCMKLKKKTRAVRAARSESIVIHLFIIYLITFTTAEKQAVVAVAQQSKAPN